MLFNIGFSYTKALRRRRLHTYHCVADGPRVRAVRKIFDVVQLLTRAGVDVGVEKPLSMGVRPHEIFPLDDTLCEDK